MFIRRILRTWPLYFAFILADFAVEAPILTFKSRFEYIRTRAA